MSLIRCHREGFIETASKNIKGHKSTAKSSVDTSASPVPVGNRTLVFKDGQFKRISDSEEDPQDIFINQKTWNLEDDKVYGFRSFSQEAAVEFIFQGGFAPSHRYSGGDFYGIDSHYVPPNNLI